MRLVKINDVALLGRKHPKPCIFCGKKFNGKGLVLSIKRNGVPCNGVIKESSLGSFHKECLLQEFDKYN